MISIEFEFTIGNYNFILPIMLLAQNYFFFIFNPCADKIILNQIINFTIIAQLIGNIVTTHCPT